MAKQRRKDLGLADRIGLWLRENQKVLIVVLLAVLSFTFAFPVGMGGRSGDPVQARIFGRDLTQAEIAQTYDRLGAVSQLAPVFFQGAYPTLAGRREAGARGEGISPLEFLVYLEKAKRLGLRMTDEEFGHQRRELWRQATAETTAWRELGNKYARENKPLPDPRRDFGFLYGELLPLRMRILEDLQARNAFDREEWNKWVKEIAASRRVRGGLSVSAFEEALRDVLLVARLGEYVQQTVKVSEEEVYQRYQEEEQRRRLSWLELEPAEDLEGTVAAAFSEEDLEKHYDAHREKYERPLRIRTDYLLIPAEHFTAEVAESLDEAALEDAYRQSRHLYPRPQIRSDEAEFVLRTEEETRAHEDELYLPFQEVREQVREKLIKDRARERRLDFASKLRLRLHPAQTRDPEQASEENRQLGPERPATFAELAAEYPFLKTGRTDFAAQEEAEKVFGEAYDESLMSGPNGWFSTAQAEGALNARQLEMLKSPRSLYVGNGSGPLRSTSDEKASVFYANVEISKPHLPELADVREDVRRDAAREKMRELLYSAAQREAEALNEGAKTLEQLAGAEIELPLEGEEKGLARASELKRTPGHLGRFETIQLPRPPAEKDPPGDEEDAEWPPPEEVHPASRSLLDAAFAIEEAGKAAVARASEKAVAHIVRLDSTSPPDPAGFGMHRDRLHRSLLREKQTEYFSRWQHELFREAYGATLRDEEDREVARAGR
jgi:hypothetical protein